MAKRFLRVWWVGGIVFLAATGIVPSAKAANSDYLRWVGPPPLRFAPVPPPQKTSYFQKLLLTQRVNARAESSEKNPPPSGPPPLALSQTATTNTANVDTNLSGIFAVPPPGLRPLNRGKMTRIVATSPPPEPAKNAESDQSANDLLNISPDMLIHYFKYNGSQTNQANVSSFVPVGFVPPRTTVSSSSRAVYQTP